MGMFDWFRAACPTCGRTLEWQSKAGPCNLNDYSPADVDPTVALDLHNQTEECEHCGSVVSVHTQYIIVVNLIVK
jgi:endogenous inhibitor of DNA gyrase (YacG/DUF329 family)